MQTEMKTYIPTAEEWRQALDATRHRRSSRTLDIVKTVILALAVAYCWVPFFIVGFKEGFAALKGEWDGFILGVVALLVAVSMWLIPWWSLRRDAAKIAAREVTVRLTLTDEGLGFGEGDTYQCIPFANIRATAIDHGLAVAFLEQGSLSVVPYRVLTVSEVFWLMDRLLPKEEA